MYSKHTNKIKISIKILIFYILTLFNIKFILDINQFILFIF